VEIAAPDSAVLFLCALNFANSAFFRKKIAILPAAPYSSHRKVSSFKKFIIAQQMWN